MCYYLKTYRVNVKRLPLLQIQLLQLLLLPLLVRYYRVVKALDSQIRDRGFESRSTLSLLYLEFLGKICTQNVLRFTQP